MVAPGRAVVLPGATRQGEHRAALTAAIAGCSVVPHAVRPDVEGLPAHVGATSIRDTQRRWLWAALQSGVDAHGLRIVEWDFAGSYRHGQSIH